MKLKSSVASHLKSLRQLRTLILSSVDIATLDSLLDCRDLQSLSISEARNLASISAVALLPRMRKMCITKCTSVDWYSLGTHPQLDLFGDAWATANVQKIYDESIGSETDYWVWRDMMLQENISADRYFDLFVEPKSP